MDSQKIRAEIDSAKAEFGDIRKELNTRTAKIKEQAIPAAKYAAMGVAGLIGLKILLGLLKAICSIAWNNKLLLLVLSLIGGFIAKESLSK